MSRIIGPKTQRGREKRLRNEKFSHRPLAPVGGQATGAGVHPVTAVGKEVKGTATPSTIGGNRTN